MASEPYPLRPIARTQAVHQGAAVRTYSDSGGGAGIQADLRTLHLALGRGNGPFCHFLLSGAP